MPVHIQELEEGVRGCESRVTGLRGDVRIVLNAGASSPVPMTTQ